MVKWMLIICLILAVAGCASAGGPNCGIKTWGSGQGHTFCSAEETRAWRYQNVPWAAQHDLCGGTWYGYGVLGTAAEIAHTIEVNKCMRANGWSGPFFGSQQWRKP